MVFNFGGTIEGVSSHVSELDRAVLALEPGRNSPPELEGALIGAQSARFILNDLFTMRRDDLRFAPMSGARADFG